MKDSFTYFKGVRIDDCRYSGRGFKLRHLDGNSFLMHTFASEAAAKRFITATYGDTYKAGAK